MPTITISVEHEVEVYCGTCGNHMCLNTEYTQGRTRGVDQFRVDVCDKCISRKDEEIDDLKKEIKELEEQISNM